MITLQEMAVFNSLFLKTIKGMKNKKSSGRDEVTQEQMILGAEVLTVPLTRIRQKLNHPQWNKKIN